MFFSLQKKKWKLSRADCTNLPISFGTKETHKVVWSRHLVLDTNDPVWVGMSLIPLPGLMYLYDKLILSFGWYSYNVQSSCIVVF